MRWLASLSLLILCLGALACESGTYVAVTIRQAVTTPATTRIDLALELEGRMGGTVLSEPDNSPIASPTSVVLRVANGSGRMRMVATARDASGSTINQATKFVDVQPNEVVSVDLELTASGGPGTPGPPLDVVAMGGNTRATVSWMPPMNTGTTPITTYSIASSPGDFVISTADGDTTSATFEGLTNGVTYTFVVRATNTSGTGVPSLPSNPVTPTAVPMVPSAPTGVTAVADVDRGAHVKWTAADNRGSPLTLYTVSSSPNAGAAVQVAAGSTMAVVSGLAPGTQYTFTVTATNAIGESQPSAPSVAITAGTKPDAPASVSAVPNVDQGATVTWSAPANTGFLPLTNYTVTATPGGMTATTSDGATTSAKVMGLTNGQPYTFTVVANNAVGSSPPSAASTPITVVARLPAPTNVIVCGANGQARLSFAAVAGATSYSVFYNSTVPATAGTKVTVASSPAIITAPNGAYFFSVAAVNSVGDGATSNDQMATLSAAVHDALFVGASGAVDIYDCYSKLPDGAAPTRSLVPGVAGFNMLPYSAFAVDGPGAVIYVADSGNQRVHIWENATTLSGNPAPSFTLGGATNAQLGNPAALAVDPAHKALYVHNNTQTTIKRFNYAASPAQLNGDVAPSALLNGPSSFSAFQLQVQQPSGDLWAAYYHNTGGGGGSLFAAAYSLPTNSSPTKTIRIQEANPNNDFQGVVYSPAGGGTLYLCNPLNNAGLHWLTGVDALGSGTYSRSGFLVGNYVALAIAGTRVVAQPGTSTATAYSWDSANISGASTKTVSSARTTGAGLVYIP
jgi:hypothetical protein